MGYISVGQLKQGMELAEDVLDVNARLLLPKGSEVLTKHIRMFKMWGVGEVNVAGDHGGGGDAGAVTDPALLEKAALQAKQIFKLNDLNHPLIKELFTLSVLHRAKGCGDVDDGPTIPPGGSSEPVPAVDVRTEIRKKNLKLPEIPSIVCELNEITADPFSSADDIAQVVNKSPSLASLILKIVNSAFYGFPGKIDRISRAVALIGSKEISALGMGITTLQLFKEIPTEIIDLKRFFKHSLACGVVSRMLAAVLNVQNTEQLFVAGLLHDIGRIVIYKYYPRQSKEALCRALQTGSLLYHAESDLLRCHHTHIGKDLFKKWKLPYSLENSAYYHHRPSTAPDPTQPAIVHLADVSVHALGLGSSGEPFAQPLDIPAVEDLSLTPGGLKNALTQGLNQLRFLETVFQESA